MDKKTALLIIDIQNDYFPGGRMELVGSVEAANQASLLLKFFREHKAPRFFVQHVSTRPGASFFLPNTKGKHINESVQPDPKEPVIIKHHPNSFRDTELMEKLQNANVGKLVVCGMMTHLSIDATVRAATDLGFTCLTAQDACTTRSLTLGDYRVEAVDVHHAFLAALNGVYGKVMTT